MKSVVRALLLAMLLTGCAASGQGELAKKLHTEASSAATDIMIGEAAVLDAMERRDAAGVEAGILKADSIKRSWKKSISAANGELAEAADMYTRALEARTKEFEAASRVALYRRVEDSRAAVRYQEEAMDLTDEALSKLEKLAR